MKWAYAAGIVVLLSILLVVVFLSVQGKLVEPEVPVAAPPADAYRYLRVIESADDTIYTGTLPSGADYDDPAATPTFWIPTTPNPDIHKMSESVKTITLPDCTGDEARYLYSYRDVLGDLTQWQQEIFNEPNALLQVATWNDSTTTYNYRVYAGKKRWVCATVYDEDIEVMP